jgi:TolB protein
LLRALQGDLCEQPLPHDKELRMMKKRNRGMTVLLLSSVLILCSYAPALSASTDTVVSQANPERHLANIRQLTFGGQNAEAYFSHDGQRLIFQSKRGGNGCDQIYTMDLTGQSVQMVSTGHGATTCSFFSPNQPRLLFSSTHEGGEACPPKPDRSRGYTWALHSTYNIYTADLDGGNLHRITHDGAYNAEGAYSPDGTKIIFTSHRDHDLDIYTMNSDGSNVSRLTNAYGYDGGPFYSWSGKYIAYRSFHPKTDAERDSYREDLANDIFRPTWLELFVMKADGSEKQQVTDLGAATFSPFLHPNDQQIIFSSNHGDPKGRTFSLFLVNVDGSGLEQVTFEQGFASFPMFSPDGSKLVFVSSRNAKSPHEFNVFLADWIP